MPGTKCLIPWCDKHCTTGVCSPCKERISRIYCELEGLKFWDRPRDFNLMWQRCLKGGEAVKLLWETSKECFTVTEANIVTKLSRDHIARYCRRAIKRGEGERQGVRKDNRRYLLSRGRVLALIRMRVELEKLTETQVPLGRAAGRIGISQSTLSWYVNQGRVPATPTELGREVFLQPGVVEALTREKREVLPPSVARRELRLRDSRSLTRAIQSGRVKVVPTEMSRFSQGIERAEIRRVKSEYVIGSKREIRKRGYRSIPEAARELGISRDRIGRWLERNKMQSKVWLVGGYPLLSRVDFKNLKAALEQEKILIGWRDAQAILGIPERKIQYLAAKHNLAVKRISNLEALTPEGLKTIAEFLGLNHRIPQRRR